VEEGHAKVNIACTLHGRNPLHHASSKGRLDIARVLVKQAKVDLNNPDNFGFTPLLLASTNGHFNMVKFLLEECHKCIKQLW